MTVNVFFSFHRKANNAGNVISDVTGLNPAKGADNVCDISNVFYHQHSLHPSHNEIHAGYIQNEATS
jgi:hypothetical protein